MSVVVTTTTSQGAAPTAGVAGRTAARATHDPNAVSVGRWAVLFGQLLLLLLIVNRFALESEAFFRLSALTVGGFALHYFLPLPRRLPFFVLLSLGGLVLVLGPTQAAWLVGLGLGLIGIAHLPFSFRIRSALLIAVGVGLAVPRWGLGQVPWSAAVWPILGSMFVFRMIVYMYDRKHAKDRVNWWQTLGYFFLLPNVCFPLFPVVDYKKFCRNYYDDERHKIYQVGVEWMWRGLLQLVLYRLVYYHLTVDSVAITNLGELLVYMLSTFMLYVRISGHFHLVIGMLHLFGFNLPETHHRYFLASSFTDFWRRINIYWKDFMLKVFYYPAYFKVRKLGDTTALVLATAFTFVVTWFLHLVQWFWIRGSVLIETNDIIFWTVFGLLVMVNSIYETRRPAVRTRNRARSLTESASLVLRTLGTFTVICLLWSFWTAESVTDWLLMMKAAAVLPPWTPVQLALAASLIVLGLGLTTLAVWKGTTTDMSPAIRVPVPMVYATSLLVCLLSLPAVAAWTGRGDTVESLKSASLNQRDADQFQRGYYENLLDVGRFNNELQKVYQAIPTDFVRSLSALGLSRPTGDEQDYELVPLKEGRFVGRLMRTNRWGMRDRDYPVTPSAGVHRIALLGPSTAMGSGVDEHESFEAIIERRLNDSGNGRQYEVLNFGVAGYSPLHMLFQLQRKVLPFQPQMAIFLGHNNDLERTSRYFTRMVQKDTMPVDDYLLGIQQASGMKSDTGANEARRRIRPYQEDLLQWVYSSFVRECRQRSITPVFVYMPTVTEPLEPWHAPERARLLERARQAGFQVIDLTGAYEGYTAPQLWIAENDGHPNALGNQLLADRLYARLPAVTEGAKHTARQ